MGGGGRKGQDNREGEKEGGRVGDREREGGRDSFVSPDVQNSRCSKRKRIWLEVPCDLEVACLSGQANSLPRHIHIKQGRKSGLQDEVHLVAELEGVDMAVLGSEGRGGGRGHIEEPEAHRFKRQWNVAVPLLLSFRLFFILGNLGRPPAKRD